MKKSGVVKLFFLFLSFFSLFGGKDRKRERDRERGRTDNGASFFYTLRDLPIVRIRWVDDFVIKLSPVEIK